MPNTTELSHIWRDLPLHVVYQILEHLTDLTTAECTFSDDFPSDPLFMADFTGKVYRYWQDFRHDVLFRHQKRRFEQHFRDHWLTRLAIYLKLDEDWGNADHIYPNRCVRYLPFSDFDTMDTSAMLQVNPTVTAGGQVVDHHDTDSEKVKFFLREPFLRSYHNRASILYAVVLDGQADALPDLVTGAWERIVANDGSSVGTYTFGVGIRKPRLLEFQETWASDFVRS